MEDGLLCGRSGEKHVRDIRRMIELSGAMIDRKVLADELERRGLLACFRGIAQTDTFA